MRILHLALGGCFAGPPTPFGVTEDTGGHVAYVLGTAAAQAEWPGVTAVDIATRLFEDATLGDRFAQPVEQIAPKLRILRVATGDRRYLSKGGLAGEIQPFGDALLARLRRIGARYDLVHAHFADAAAVAARLRAAFGTPFLYHAHSLGLDKQAVAGAADAERIAAEDRAIGAADGIVASSRDEVVRQLAAYPAMRPARVLRVAPGVERAPGPVDTTRAARLLAPFLRQPGRPLIVAVARPVLRKNLVGLVELYAASPALRRRADLVILAGLRDDLATAEPEQAAVFRRLLDAVDRHDLYGHVALPKRHERADVFALYHLAAASGGVFAQPAFCEPYGLTIAEAAAAGLPVVATHRGGARDVVAELGCGLLADPTDPPAFAAAIEALLADPARWREAAATGRARAAARDWAAWARPVMAFAGRLPRPGNDASARRLLVSDMDATLTGSRAAAARFAAWRATRRDLVFAIATGRPADAAVDMLDDWALPLPEILIAGAGAEILHRTPEGRYEADAGWAEWAAWGWQPDAVAAVLDTVPGLTRQPADEQRALKRSWFGGPDAASVAATRLREAGLATRLVHSHGRCLDALPPRAGKGAAMRWCADALRMDAACCVAAGDSGNDADLLAAAGRGILVGNHDADLRHLVGFPHIHRSEARFADGVLEGLARWLPGPGASRARSALWSEADLALTP